jgi:hypothetical protein
MAKKTAKKSVKKVVKTPAKKVSKPAKSPKGLLSLSQLVAESASLTKRQQLLETAIAAVEALNGATTKVARTSKKTATGRAGSRPERNGKPTLEVVFKKVLAKNPKGLTLEDACDKVAAAGYKSKSDSFAPVLGQLIHKLRTNKEIVSVPSGEGRKKLYKAA